MKQLRGFLAFLYDFVIGDDWRIAAGVVAALAVTALIADTSISAWWVLPAAVAVLLAASLSRELRRRRRA
jgi:predicted branched-subunit amino acid permease